MNERETKFVEVILPLALPQTFTYRVPFDWNDAILIGQRVIVQFGKGKKQYSVQKKRKKGKMYSTEKIYLSLAKTLVNKV